MISASAKFLAINWQSSAGACALLPLSALGKRKGEPPMLHAHSAEITDLAWSPLDDNLLATASADASIKIWTVPDNVGEAGAEAPSATQTLSGHKRTVGVLAWHPCASGVLASGGNDNVVKIWDVASGAERQTVSVFADNVEGLSWNSNGSLLAVVSKDHFLRIVDPRSGAVVQEGAAHGGLKPMRVVWLGDAARILTTGFGKTRERQFGVWDAANLSAPLKMHNLDSATGVLDVLYDADCQLAFLCGKGESAQHVIELTDAAPFFNQVTSATGADAAKGCALLPKRACSVANVEIDRILKVTKDAVVPVSFCVPRKARAPRWAEVEELYPLAVAARAALSGDEWFAGADRAPLRCSMDPSKAPPLSSSSSAQPTASAAKPTHTFSATPAAASSSSPAPASSASVAARSAAAGSAAASASTGDSADTPYAPSAKAVAAGKVVRSSHYRHIGGKTNKKDLTYYDMDVTSSGSQTNEIQANALYFACLLKGNAGPIAVVPRTRFGRQPKDLAKIELGAAVTDLAFSPFDDNLLATADDSGHIKLWQLPITAVCTEPLKDLRGHSRKVTTLNWHPTARDILVSTSMDRSIRVWDATTGEARLVHKDAHDDLVNCVTFNYDGSLFATASKDLSLRVFDLRSGACIASVPQAHAGAKGFGLAWLGNTDLLFTIGWTRSSDRESTLWRLTGKSSLVEVERKSVDQQSGLCQPYYDEDTGVVFCAGKGDINVKAFEVEMDPPSVHFLTQIVGDNDPQKGVAFVPKYCVDVAQVEIAHMLKVTASSVQPVSLTVPRTRMEFFQDDIFPSTRSNKASLSAADWFAGKDSKPILTSIKPAGMTALSQAPAIVKSGPKYTLTEVVKQADVRDQLYDKMNGMKGQKSKEDAEAELREGAGDDEWDDS